LPNMKNVVAAAQNHPAGYISSLLAIGLAYNPQHGTPTSWTDLWDAKYKGKVALSGWPGSPATVQLVMAARLNGGSDDNLEPGFAALQRLLPAKFFPQGPSAEPFYVQGDVWIHPAIHGAVLQMKDKGVPIDWVAPKEGAAADYNVLVIPKGVKNKAAAEKFVDFFLGPDVQLAYASGLFYAPVNQSVQLPPDVAAKVHPTVEEQRNLQAIPWEKISARESDLTERWNREIAGR
jgi:putative spermidine/putrescine transport system substrate-binding protein